MKNIKAVFSKELSTNWLKIVDFDNDLNRPTNRTEGFEIYCESEIKIEFGIGSNTSVPAVVLFTLQPKLLWKYMQDIPLRGVLYARAESGTPTIELEI